MSEALFDKFYFRKDNVIKSLSARGEKIEKLKQQNRSNRNFGHYSTRMKIKDYIINDVKKTFNYNKIPRNFDATIEEMIDIDFDFDDTIEHSHQNLLYMLKHNIVAYSNFIYTASETFGEEHGDLEVDKAKLPEHYAIMKKFMERLPIYQSKLPNESLKYFAIISFRDETIEEMGTSYCCQIEVYYIFGKSRKRNELVEIFKKMEKDGWHNPNGFFLI